MIKYFDTICLILITVGGLACGYVTSDATTASSSPIPVTSPTPTPSPGPTPIASAGGYAFASGAANVQGATYKLRVRLGKLDTSSALNGATYKIKTGKSRILNDM